MINIFSFKLGFLTNKRKNLLNFVIVSSQASKRKKMRCLNLNLFSDENMSDAQK